MLSAAVSASLTIADESPRLTSTFPCMILKKRYGELNSRSPFITLSHQSEKSWAKQHWETGKMEETTAKHNVRQQWRWNSAYNDEKFFEKEA